MLGFVVHEMTCMLSSGFRSVVVDRATAKFVPSKADIRASSRPPSYSCKLPKPWPGVTEALRRTPIAGAGRAGRGHHRLWTMDVGSIRSFAARKDAAISKAKAKEAGVDQPLKQARRGQIGAR